MKRKAIQNYCGVSPNPRVVFVIVFLTTIISVPACIVGAACINTGGRITLLSASYNGFGDSIQTTEQSAEWQTVRMRVTAYCPCEKCCGKYADGQTACLHKIRPGDVFVAADEEYCFGTEMIIDGYNDGKPVKVLDRGGAIRGDRIDVFFNSHEEALQWGVKYLDVKVRTTSQTQ